jgi:hypothetical protein
MLEHILTTDVDNIVGMKTVHYGEGNYGSNGSVVERRSEKLDAERRKQFQQCDREVSNTPEGEEGPMEQKFNGFPPSSASTLYLPQPARGRVFSRGPDLISITGTDLRVSKFRRYSGGAHGRGRIDNIFAGCFLAVCRVIFGKNLSI